MEERYSVASGTIDKESKSPIGIEYRAVNNPVFSTSSENVKSPATQAPAFPRDEYTYVYEHMPSREQKMNHQDKASDEPKYVNIIE